MFTNFKGQKLLDIFWKTIPVYKQDSGCNRRRAEKIGETSQKNVGVKIDGNIHLGY